MLFLIHAFFFLVLHFWNFYLSPCVRQIGGKALRSQAFSQSGQHPVVHAHNTHYPVGTHGIVRLIRAEVVVEVVEEKVVVDVDGDGSGTFWLLLLLLLLLLVLVLWLLGWLLRLLGRRWWGWQLVVVVVGLVGRRSRPTLVRGRRHQRSLLSACCRRLLLPQLPADHGSAIHVRVLRGATAEEERGPRRGPTAAAATAAGPHRRRDARHCAEMEDPTPTHTHNRLGRRGRLPGAFWRPPSTALADLRQ